MLLTSRVSLEFLTFIQIFLSTVVEFLLQRIPLKAIRGLPTVADIFATLCTVLECHSY